MGHLHSRLITMQNIRLNADDSLGVGVYSEMSLAQLDDCQRRLGSVPQ